MAVLVTGAGAGIGRAIARRFAGSGAALVLVDVDAAAVAGAATEMRGLGGVAETVVGPVEDERTVDAAFAAVDAAGGIEALINNAGIAANRPTLDLDAAAWDRAMAVNLRGAFLMAREAGRRMVAAGRGVILNMASMYGVVAAPERLAYCVSKAGLVMMTKALAIEWAHAGVRVNAVAPGYVDTDLVRALVAAGRLDVAALERRTPMGRLTDPEEIADAAMFLCSDQACYVTGQVLGVDGGWTAYGYV